MTEAAAERLAYEVVRQAVVDYVTALRYLAKHSEPELGTRERDTYNQNRRNLCDCEWFFRYRLDYYVDMDGELVMEELRRQAGNKKYKVGKAIAWDSMENERRKG